MTQVQERKDYTTEDAIKAGQDQAKVNVAKEREESTIADAPTRDEIAEDARETAKANHKAEVKEQKKVEVDSNELTNDTSKAAKKAVTESQLHPGFDVLGEEKKSPEAEVEEDPEVEVEVEKTETEGKAKK